MQSLLTECKMNGKSARLHELVVISILLLALHHPSVQSAAVASVSDAAYSELWQGYERDVRPMCGDYPAPVQVQLGVAMRQLMELDEPTQMLSSCIWLRIGWQDCRLTWNTSDYNDIVRLTVPRAAVWTPDLTLYDNAESTLGDLSDYRINVGSTGDISSLIPVVIKSMCLLNLRTFPFDTQICKLTFGSWTYNGLELNLTAALNASDISAYVEHGEWDLLSFTESVLAPVFGGVPYPQVVFSIKLKRRPLFYVMNLVFPSLLIKSLAIIGFLLPPESGEKVNLEVTVLLSLSVFQLVVLRTMPPTSENIPIIALFFLLAMVLVALSCVMTVIVLSVHFTEHYRALPKSFRGLLTGTLGRAFGMNQIVKSSWSARKASMQSGGNLVETSLGHDTITTTPVNPDRRASSIVKTDNSSQFNTLADSAAEITSSSVKSLPEQYRAALHRDDSSEDAGLNSLLHTSKTMLRHLEGLIACQEKKDHRNRFESEWRIFAMFLDRILLCLFFCLGLVLTSSVYLTISTS